MICPRCHKSTLQTNHGLLLGGTCCWRCVGIDELVGEIERLTLERVQHDASERDYVKTLQTERNNLSEKNEELRAKLANVGCPAGMKICPLGLWKPGEEHPADPSDTTARLNRHLDKVETTTRLIPRDTTPKSFSEDMGAIAESHHRKPIGIKKSAAPKPTCNLCHGTGRIMSDVEMDGYETRPCPRCNKPAPETRKR